MKIAAIALLAASAALAGCNVHAKHDNDNDGNETVKISGGSDGNVSFDLPFMKGQVKLPEGAMHSGDFDIDGVKMYPGATINGFNVNASNNVSVVNLGFKAPASADKVRAYFVDQFKQKGVEARASGDGVTGKSKDGSPFEIHVSDSGSGSQGTIRIEDNDKDRD